MSDAPGPRPAVPVVVVAHDPAWQSQAAALLAELRGPLGPLALRAEHIGSTSIPGMAAKPVLDLQVSVADLDEAAGAFARPLAERGFERLPYERDHVPAGRDDDPARWAKRYWRRRGADAGQEGALDVNLHVRRAGSPNERLALLFRDWFRAHPGAVAGVCALQGGAGGVGGRPGHVCGHQGPGGGPGGRGRGALGGVDGVDGREGLNRA